VLIIFEEEKCQVNVVPLGVWVVRDINVVIFFEDLIVNLVMSSKKLEIMPENLSLKMRSYYGYGRTRMGKFSK